MMQNQRIATRHPLKLCKKTEADVDTEKPVNGKVENTEALKRQSLSDLEKSIEMAKNDEVSFSTSSTLTNDTSLVLGGTAKVSGDSNEEMKAKGALKNRSPASKDKAATTDAIKKDDMPPLRGLKEHETEATKATIAGQTEIDEDRSRAPAYVTALNPMPAQKPVDISEGTEVAGSVREATSATKQGEAPSTTPEVVATTPEVPLPATAPISTITVDELPAAANGMSNITVDDPMDVGRVDESINKADKDAASTLPNQFKKKTLFMRMSNANIGTAKKSLLRQESTGDSSMSGADEWGSDDETEEGETPRIVTRKSTLNASRSIPLISIGDKLEADKEAEVGTPKRRRRKRRSIKSQRESNLDPAFLRATFKQRIRKLVTLNRFFQEANETAFEKEMGKDRKSCGYSKRQSLFSGMDESDMADLINLELDDGEESAMSLSSVSSHAPPALAVQPQKSAVRSKERNNGQRANRSVTFPPDEKMHEMKFIPLLTEEQAKELFWTGEELKLIRFEKFMEANANEFELVDDEEYEEEYEEISWVSGEEEYDEESWYG